MKPTKGLDEVALEFRAALLSDFVWAGTLLREHPELINYPSYGKAQSALHFFAIEDEEEILNWLIKHGANPNGISDSSNPLRDAASLGLWKICQILVDAGAELNRVSSGGDTALHHACQRAHIETIGVLLAAGIDASLTEVCGETAFEQVPPKKRQLVRMEFEKHS